MSHISRPNFDLYTNFVAVAKTLPDIVAKRQEINQGLVGAAWSMFDGFVLHRICTFVLDSSSCGLSYLPRPMVLAMRGCRRHSACVPRSIACMPVGQCGTLCKGALSASTTKPNTSIPQACCRHWTYATPSRLTLRWTSLNAFSMWAASRLS